MRRLVVHGALLAHHAVTAVYLLSLDYSGETHSYLIDAGYYPWRFATIWNFVIQTTFLALCLLEDLTALKETKVLDDIRRKLKQLNSFLFAALIFPTACGVFFTFWIVYYYNRELIYPTVVDAKLPTWSNHSLHTVVLVAVLLEMGISYRPYPKTYNAMILLQSYMGSYTLVTLVTYSLWGTWVYHMLDVMTWSQRFLFFLSLHFFGVVFYNTGKFLNSVVWDDSLRKRGASQGFKTRPLERHKD